jgi:hypothetical protein
MLSQLFTNMGVEVNEVEFKRGSVFSQTSDLTKALLAGCFQAQSFEEALEKDFLGDESGIQPELDMKTGSCIWKVAGTKTGEFDLDRMQADNDAGAYRVAYLSFWVFSPKPMDEILADPNVPRVHFEFSASMGSKVWLNRREVYQNRAATEGALIEKLPLKKGWNQFLVKVVGTPDAWKFRGKLISGDMELLASMRSALNPYSEKANFSVVKHTDPEIVYDQYWGLQGDGWYESASPGAKAMFKFYGTGLKMTGLVFDGGGTAKLYIDGKFECVIDYKREVRDPHGVIFTTSGLRNGEHEVVLEVIDGWVALGPFEQWESY